MEWKINYIKPYKFQEEYIPFILIISLPLTILIIYIIFAKFEIGAPFLIIFLFIIFSLFFDFWVLLNLIQKKKALKWFDDLLKNIKKIETEEKDKKLLIKLILNKPFNRLKIKSGEIFIERYIVSTGKSSHIVTKYRINEHKKYEFNNNSQIEFEIERRKVLGYLEKERGFIEGSGIILEGIFKKKFIILFSDDTLKEKFRLKENILTLQNSIRAYLEVLSITEREIKMYLSITNKEKARSFKVEIEWVNKMNIRNPYIVRELISRNEDVGSYEINYKLFEKDDKNIYIFPEFYFPEKIKLLKIAKSKNFKIFLKLSADFPLSPDKTIKTEITFE
ncbi:MAG: hypothetical protein ABIM76_05015 [candidate division WOR-3 bacterium]